MEQQQNSNNKIFVSRPLSLNVKGLQKGCSHNAFCYISVLYLLCGFKSSTPTLTQMHYVNGPLRCVHMMRLGLRLRLVTVKTCPHQAKVNAKAKIFFDVCRYFFFLSQPIVLWSFLLSRSLNVNRLLGCIYTQQKRIRKRTCSLIIAIKI